MGVAQAVADYEAGRLRLLAGALPNLSERLGVTVEALDGTPSRRGNGEGGPAPKMQQQLERITRLPKAQ